MKTTDLEKPFRLSRDFWAAYALLGIPVLWFARPWNWELPIYSKAAGFVFLPFAAAIVCYCPFLFIAAITRGSSKERKIGLAFLAAFMSAALFLTAIWIAYDFGGVPSRFGFIAVIVANVVFAFLQARQPNQPAQHNAGSRPVSSDSPASETPSAPAPRG